MTERDNFSREVVEIYRRPAPREVVEVYRRPLPGTEQTEEKSSLKRRKRSREDFGIFLACFVGVVVLAVLASALTGIGDEPRGDPFEQYYEGMEMDVDAPITIPTVPFGQGAELKLVREREEALTAQEVYRRVNPAVVTVVTYLEDKVSVGTGVIFTADGYILTNQHVLAGGEECMVALDTGDTYSASYVGSDIDSDLAVLKIDGTDFPAAEFGDSDLMEVGDQVYAIGNPLGVELRGTLTDGIVSAINRDVWVDDRYMTLIQTNAALNSGNSGGPLINEYGQVVGINVIKMTSNYSNIEGLGFAIPSASVDRIANDLLTFGELQPEPLLGISVIITAEEAAEDVWGLRVDEVTPGGAGDLAGVRKGDFILTADGEELRTSQDLLRVRRHHYVGEEMHLTVWRDGEILELTLHLANAVEKGTD